MQPTSSKKEIWTMGTYSLLTLSIMVGFMYLNTFATEVLKIPASTLATALLIAKSCDFVVSLFCGIIVEKVKLGKKGKNQGWLYYGRWILAVAIMLEVINTSTAPMAARVVVLGLSYTVLNCLMNIMQTAYYGVVAVVAGPNPANRNAMTINMIRQNTVVMLICSFIPTLVTKLPFGSWNYFIVALVFMLPMPWALGNISRLAEGKDLPVGQGPAGAPRVTIKDMLESLFKNPQLLALFISFTILQIGMFMYQANYTYYFIYVIGDFTKLTLATLAASLVGVVAAMFMPKLGTKIGKKWACVLGFILFGLGLVGVNLMGAQHWVWYIIFMSFGTCGTYIYSSFQVTMYLDCGEWYLNKTGKDMRTIAIGLASPPLKIGMAVGGTIGLYLLGATGYVAGFTPDEAWVKSFMFICWIVPAVIYFAAAAIMAIFYKITDAEAARCAQETPAKQQQKKYLQRYEKPYVAQRRTAIIMDSRPCAHGCRQWHRHSGPPSAAAPAPAFSRRSSPEGRSPWHSPSGAWNWPRRLRLHCEPCTAQCCWGPWERLQQRAPGPQGASVFPQALWGNRRISRRSRQCRARSWKNSGCPSRSAPPPASESGPGIRPL